MFPFTKLLPLWHLWHWSLSYSLSKTQETLEKHELVRRSSHGIRKTASAFTIRSRLTQGSQTNSNHTQSTEGEELEEAAKKMAKNQDPPPPSYFFFFFPSRSYT